MQRMRPIAVVFTGSPEELRQHARRDLLINIALGGLYTSVARRNVAAYLASRTSIDGVPLVQVPRAKSPWPALVLVLAFVALRVAHQFGAGPPLPWLVAGATLLLPYLWGTVTARSIDAIGWREWRLSFQARWSEIYRASWPLLVLGFAWALAEPAVAAFAEKGPGGDPTALVAGAAAVALVAFPLLAALAFNFRRLRFTRTRVGERELAWPARFATYLRVCVLAALAMLATAILPVLALRIALLGSFTLQGVQTGEAVVVYAVALAAAVLLSAPARAWYEARVFALTWNGVRIGDRLRVECAIDARAYARMRTRAAWRTFLTFGARRAHGLVKAYETKLAALSVWEE